MIASGIIIYCAVAGVMAAAAWYFGNRIRFRKIPMQWGFDGQPTWYAPKWIGLLTPVCIAAAGGPLFLVAVGAPPSAYYSALGLIVFSAVMATAYIIYLALLMRWASKQPSE